jgi:hypothetical protein
MSWGNKILLTFLVFAGGMVYLVYRSMQTNFELVEKDYYKKELVYQDIIDGTNRTNQLSTVLTIRQNENGLLLCLPEEMKNKKIEGEFSLYCAFDAARDKKLPLQTDSDATQLIPVENIRPGNYTAKVKWTESGKNYCWEKSITIL